MKLQLTSEELDFLMEVLRRYERQLKADRARRARTTAAEVLAHESEITKRILSRLQALDLIEEVGQKDYR